MKHILVAVSGLTPQIVTEALYCLKKKRGITIEEIYIITTQRGKNVIAGTDRGASAQPAELAAEIALLAKKLKIPVPAFLPAEPYLHVAAEETTELSDIRNDKDNTLFPNKVCAIIRQLSANPEQVLHCVISGGRKSMSVHLALAMTLFGREPDMLWHILTSESFEFKDYYPKTKAAEQSLELSEIPFVRLRSFLSESKEAARVLNKSYNDIVQFTQRQLQLAGSSKKLSIDISKRTLTYDGNSVTFTMLEFVLFYFFIERALLKRNAISISELQENATADELSAFIRTHYPYHSLEPKSKGSWWNTGIGKERFRTLRSKMNDKICKLIPDTDMQSRFIIDGERIYGDSRYCIRAKKEQVKIIKPD